MTLTKIVNGEVVALSPEEEAEIRSRWAEADKPKPVVVHAAWFRAALAEIGAVENVNRAVAAQGPVAATLWEYATTIRSDDPDVIAVAAAVGVDLSALFARALEIRGQRAG